MMEKEEKEKKKERRLTREIWRRKEEKDVDDWNQIGCCRWRSRRKDLFAHLLCEQQVPGGLRSNSIVREREECERREKRGREKKVGFLFVIFQALTYANTMYCAAITMWWTSMQESRPLSLDFGILQVRRERFFERRGISGRYDPSNPFFSPLLPHFRTRGVRSSQTSLLCQCSGIPYLLLGGLQRLIRQRFGQGTFSYMEKLIPLFSSLSFLHFKPTQYITKIFTHTNIHRKKKKKSDTIREIAFWMEKRKSWPSLRLPWHAMCFV